MRIQTFWVVSQPTPDSEIEDIVFETTLHGIDLQYKGGLKSSEVLAMFVGPEAKKEARALGEKLLKLSKRYYGELARSVEEVFCG